MKLVFSPSFIFLVAIIKSELCILFLHKVNLYLGLVGGSSFTSSQFQDSLKPLISSCITDVVMRRCVLSHHRAAPCIFIHWLTPYYNS